MLHRRVFAALAALCFVLLPEHAWAQAKTKTAITTEINTNFPSGCTGCVTAALVRGALLDIVNSYVDYNGGLTFACPANQWVSSGTLSSLICTQPPAAVLVFDTIAAATAATIPATGTATIYIRGALTAGDVGAGFWTRSAGNPGHTAFFNSADGAFWSPSLANASFPIEMFGGKCDSGVTNNTTAFNKVLSFINIVSTIKLTFAPCFYYGFTTQPNASTGIPLIMTGSGPNSTTLGRNFNAALFNFTGTSGNIIKDMQICSISPATTGNLLNFNATASAGSNENRLDNLTVADCTGSHDDSLSFDGSAKITGAVGVRDNFLSNIFTKRVVLTDVVGFQWFGGLAINGSGVSFAVTSTASFNPNSIDIALSTSSGVSTVGATDVRIMAQSFAGNSTFDVNSNFVWLIGRTNTITVTNNCGTPANCGAFAH